MVATRSGSFLELKRAYAFAELACRPHSCESHAGRMAVSTEMVAETMAMTRAMIVATFIVKTCDY
jgi:hypothetical protein